MGGVLAAHPLSSPKAFADVLKWVKELEAHRKEEAELDAIQLD